MDGNKLKTYKEFINFRQQDNPCVGALSAFLEDYCLPLDTCKSYYLDCTLRGGEDYFYPYQELHYYEIASALAPPPPDHGRVIVIEDLHPSILELLGTTLDIDPIFFASYVLTNYVDVELSPAPPSVALTPSHILSQTHSFHTHYQQVIDLSCNGPLQNAPWVLKTSGNVSRSVRRLSELHGRQLGLIRSSCSVFMKHFDKSWIGIILVDSSTSAIFKESDPQLRLRREPLHSGFEEFHTPQLFSTFQCANTYPKNRRGSISKTIISYISENPAALELANPSLLSLVYYPLRVVVGEWMLYSQVLGRYMKRYEYSFRNKELTLSQYETMELHKWRHRAMQSLSKLESTRNFVSYHSTTEACKGPWDLVLKDLDHLSKNIEQYGLCLEQMIPVAASMTQLLDTRRSLMESVDVKRLTYVALIFVPLSTVAAIFSMPNDFAPGQPKFWVYFTVAVPLCISIASWLVVKPSLQSLEW